MSSYNADTDMINQHYGYGVQQKPSESTPEIVTNEKGEQGYYETVVSNPDNRPGYDVTERVFHKLQPPPKPRENITDGRWPPKVGALYNGEGPIIEKDGKYGYYYTYQDVVQGGNIQSSTIFREVKKPLSKEEIAEQRAQEMNKKTKYINEGPEGAPKVLAMVHIAYQREYTKTPPYVLTGSFVLSFYKLQFRQKDTEDTEDNDKWVYTKLFSPISVNIDSDIETRFENKLPKSQEFLASSESDYKFDPENLRLTNPNFQNEVVAYPGNSDNQYIGRAVALIGFDCDNFNLDVNSLKTSYPQNNLNDLWVVPVKLTNPRVIFSDRDALEYVINKIRTRKEALFNGFQSQVQVQNMKHIRTRMAELKNDYDNIKKSTDDRTSPLSIELRKKREELSKLETESTKKSKEHDELKQQIDKRDKILKEGAKGNWFDRNKMERFKKNDANKYMSEEAYNTAKTKEDELNKTLLESAYSKQELIKQINDIDSEINKVESELLGNPIVVEYLNLQKELSEVMPKKQPYIFYGYNYLRNQQPVFFIDPDFTSSSLIGLVRDEFLKSKGGKRRSTKSKKSMKSKRTKRTQYLKHTKKYRRRSHRK